MSNKTQFGTVTMLTTALAVNTVYQLRHDRDPFPVMMIGGIWIGAVVLIGTARPDLGTTIAAVYLLAVVLTRGADTLNWLTDATGGLSDNPSRHKPRNNSAQDPDKKKKVNR